jgi:hypothetical protein
LTGYEKNGGTSSASVIEQWNTRSVHLEGHEIASHVLHERLTTILKHAKKGGSLLVKPA